MNKKIIIAGLIVVAAIVGAIYLYISQPSSSGRFSASGTIEATEVNVGTLAGGPLVEVAVDEGDLVKKDALLARTDDAILKSQLSQAQAGLEAAQAGVEGAADGTDSERAAADAAVKQAQAGVDIAQTQLGFAAVVAPMSGEVVSVPHAVGESVAQGATVAVISDLKNLRVTVYVPEGELGKVKIGREARISVDSVRRRFTGRISHIAQEPEFTPTNIETKDQRVKQVFAVTIKVRNVNGLLKPGMPADVSFEM